MVDRKSVTLNSPETQDKKQTGQYQPVFYLSRGHCASVFQSHAFE
jgi:hypothetical protein